jgi:hypothetical protein
VALGPGAVPSSVPNTMTTTLIPPGKLLSGKPPFKVATYMQPSFETSTRRKIKQLIFCHILLSYPRTLLPQRERGRGR